ncbi:MAG: hypothetical protein J0H61_10545, partial [Alphaproteobacteria bacterium]|nr:hypothetical protein [Alphaproteobacteria bacterium]
AKIARHRLGVGDAAQGERAGVILAARLGGRRLGMAQDIETFHAAFPRFPRKSAATLMILTQA